VSLLAAVAGCVVSFASAALLAVVDGRGRSILVVPLAVVFFLGLAVFVNGLLALIFGACDEEPTRRRMVLVAACAAISCLVLFKLASALDQHAHVVAYGVGFVGAAAGWLVIVCVFAAILGKLPDTEMAEGD
jgi:hypothetical protein